MFYQPQVRRDPGGEDIDSGFSPGIHFSGRVQKIDGITPFSQFDRVMML
jgi:hypothetical protein